MLVLILAQDASRRCKSANGELLLVLRTWKKVCDHCPIWVGLYLGNSVDEVGLW